MQALNEFRNLTTDRMDMAQLLALAAFGRTLADEYDIRGLEQPEWLTENLGAVGREIDVRRKDELRRQLKQTEFELERIKPAAEKRKELAAKAKRLQAAIGE